MPSNMPSNNPSATGFIVVRYHLNVAEQKLKISVEPHPALGIESVANIMAIALSNISAQLKKEKGDKGKEKQ